MGEGDPFRLGRFLDAQASMIGDVLRELRDGRKRTHWMWFVFPQIAGLGTSPTARFYAIGGMEEARAYLADPVLGARLVECTGLVNAVPERTLGEIFGSPDDLKFRSSMTLFGRADPGATIFREALALHGGGVEDAATLARLGG